MHDLLVRVGVLGHRDNWPNGGIIQVKDTDDSLPNEYVLKCQFWSNEFESAAVKQWVGETECGCVLY